MSLCTRPDLVRPGPVTALIVLAFSLLLPARAAELLLSEFTADNQSSFVDEDGDTSDWIEIQNIAPVPVSLDGWFLTDDASRPTQWRFPARTLPPGGFLVVFASGKNRTPQPPGNLHTRFRLEAAGEYLALVRPDGRTIETEFRPTFPPQKPSLSFGFPSSPKALNLLAGSPVSILVPSRPEDIAPNWTTDTLPPGPWVSSLGFPAGFDTTPASPGSATNLALNGMATQSTTGYGLGAANANDGDLNTFSHTATNDDGSTWTLDLRAVYEIRRIILHNRPECCQTRFRDLTVTLLAADGSSVLWTSDLLNPENRLDSPASLSLDLLELGVDPVPARFVRVSRRPDPDLSGSGGVGNPDEDSVLTLSEVEVYGVESLSFASILRTDLTDVLHQRATTALARVPFRLDAPESVASLQLQLRYDDGIIVYLNGEPILTRSAPNPPVWNSTASAERNKADALVPESVDLLPWRHLWRTGTNWLALHGFNRSAQDSDFLLDAELVTSSSASLVGSYLERPTPGASNNVPSYLGLVADTRFSVQRGFYSQPFDLAITTTTPGAEIRFTLDGSIPTAQHGTIYTAPIRVTRTTVVRAAAFKPDFRPTNVDSHTFLLPASTIAQPNLPPGFPANWAGLAPDYGMDPRITQSTTYAPLITNSLLALPTLSIACNVDDLFGPSRGIYSNPERNGVSWERPISLEWIEPEGRREFQADAGLRIQGGYFRSRNATHKHSLRLLFKDQYGPGKLRTDLFETFGATREFDTLVLRAGANDGYAWDAARDTEQFLRDEFGRRLHLAMGQISPHGRFVHLYLNGLYWGLYNLTERPAEDFSASYFGGTPEDWDAVNSGEVKNGSLAAWNSFLSQVRTASTLSDYQKLKGLRADGTADPSAIAYLDATNYIDYMLLNIWGGNWDWPNKNFWFGRDRTGASGGFKFYLWDFENTMGNNRDRSPLEMVSPRAGITSSWVAEPHDRLRRLEEYRVEFADRVHRHFFHSGVLTPNALTNLYQSLAHSLQPAIVAETARWGDDHHSPPQDLSDWIRERDWLLQTYLPRRTAVVLNQFRASGLYPQTAAPTFQPPGGSVAPTTPVTLQTTGADELFYSTKGIDPRLPGGGIHPDATRVPLTPSNPGPSPSPNLVRSGAVWRYFATGTSPGNAWTQPAFADAAWPSGPSPLGYGDGDETTTVPFVDANPTQAGIQKNATTFFRTSFQAPDPAAFSELRLTLTFDDAAAVYLNGALLFRTDNLPADARFDTYASSASSDNAVATLDAIDPALLKPGLNVIAAEVHQSDSGSSDISFDLELIGIPRNAGAIQTTGPLFFSQTTHLVARARRGTEWSAREEKVFLPNTAQPSAQNLVLAQFCAQPPEPMQAAEIAVSRDRDDFEFLEFLNIGQSTLDLSGVQISGGIAFTFPNSTLLDPGHRALLVRNPAAFQARYGSQLPVVGAFEGRLANEGETLVLRATNGSILFTLTYGTQLPWSPLQELGYPLVLLHPGVAPNPSDPLNWRPASLPGGTPGRSDASRFQGNPTADTDTNGQPDLFDYAFGARVRGADSALLVGIDEIIDNTGTHRYLTLAFPWKVAAEDAQAVLESADHLQGPWSLAAAILVSETQINPGHSLRKFRLAPPPSADTPQFLRLGVHLRLPPD